MTAADIAAGGLADVDVLVATNGNAQVATLNLGKPGKDALRAWVNNGGRFVGIRGGTELAARLGLTTARLRAAHSDVPGSLFRVAVNQTSPLATGVGPFDWALYDYDDVMTDRERRRAGPLPGLRLAGLLRLRIRERRGRARRHGRRRRRARRRRAPRPLHDRSELPRLDAGDAAHPLERTLRRRPVARPSAGCRLRLTGGRRGRRNRSGPGAAGSELDQAQRPLEGRGGDRDAHPPLHDGLHGRQGDRKGDVPHREPERPLGRRASVHRTALAEPRRRPGSPRSRSESPTRAPRRASSRPLRRSGRGRRSRAGRRGGRSTTGAWPAAREPLLPSTATSSTSPAGSCSSSSSLPEPRPQPAPEEKRLAARPRDAERVRLADVRARATRTPPATAAPSPRRCRTRRCGRRARAGASKSRRSRSIRPSRGRGGRRPRVSWSSAGSPNHGSPRQRRKTGRSGMSSGMATLAGAFARGPQSRSEMTSEHTCPCSPPRTKQRRSTSPSSASRGSSGTREEEDRAGRMALSHPRERVRRRVDPALGHPREVRHDARAQVRRAARARPPRAAGARAPARSGEW